MDRWHSLENVKISATADAAEELESSRFSYTPFNVLGPGCESDPSLICFQGCNCKAVSSCEAACCTCSTLNYAGRALNDVEHNEKMIYECNINCECRDSCQNRLVQHGLCIPLEIFITKTKGMGVRAMEVVKRGEFVCEYAGEVISRGEAMRRTEKQQKNSEMNYIISVVEHFGHCDEKVSTFVDPKFQGNIGRFLNHSCEANLKMFPVRVNSTIPHLALFASRLISPGEELTFHYGSSEQNHGFNDKVLSKTCYCGKNSCSGFLPFDRTYIPSVGTLVKKA